MDKTKTSLDIKPRILYQVAKAAWEGKLFEQSEEICRLVRTEFADKATRRQVANQIRVAMGLNPHDSDTVISEHDQEALMGMEGELVAITDPAACGRWCKDHDCACVRACQAGAISRDSQGRVRIDQARCLGDGRCISACSFGTLAEKTKFVPLINMLRQADQTVYASVAPAFAGQFGPAVKPGKLRSALLKLGFADMVETALYADLITIKEAFEFDHRIRKETDFLITSCCCPVWIKLIENKFPSLLDNISPSVSPMIASARVIKTLQPEAKVVFIGPCIAKKSEAQLPGLKGAVDFVLTFRELDAIFAAANIAPADLADEENPQASRGGRLYGHTGGVSSAVETTLKKLIPHRAEMFTALEVDGMPDCQQMLEQISTGRVKANFIEGMACKGGCVGGPGRLLAADEGAGKVNDYSDRAASKTAVENPQVYALLARLGHKSEIPAMTGKGPMAVLLTHGLNNDNPQLALQPSDREVFS